MILFKYSSKFYCRLKNTHTRIFLLNTRRVLHSKLQLAKCDSSKIISSFSVVASFFSACQQLPSSFLFNLSSLSTFSVPPLPLSTSFDTYKRTHAHPSSSPSVLPNYSVGTVPRKQHEQGRELRAEPRSHTGTL